MSKQIKCAGLLSSLALLPMSVADAAEPGVNALDYPGGAWSPYVVGAGIGVLSWLTFYFSDKPIGASSFYAQVSGFIGKLFANRHTESLEYFKDNPPNVGSGIRLRGGHYCGRCDCRVDGWRVCQRMVAAHVGGAFR